MGHPHLLTHIFFILLSITTSIVTPPFDESILVLQTALDSEGGRGRPMPPVLPQWNWDGMHLASTADEFFVFEHQLAFTKNIWKVWGLGEWEGFGVLTDLWAQLPRRPLRDELPRAPRDSGPAFAPNTVQFATKLANLGPFVTLVNLAAMTVASVALSSIGRHFGVPVAPLRLALALSPASVFFIASYTEALFAAATFSGIALRLGGRPWAAALALGAATSLRSNGILGVLFLLSGSELRDFLRAQRLPPLIRIPQALLVVYPLLASQLAAATAFCPGRPWCNVAPALTTSLHSLTNLTFTFPLPYTFIQSHYWGQGFLAFFRLSQLPNFFLAGPTFAFAVHGIWTYAQQPSAHPDALPLYVHWAIYTAICFTTTHVQTSTRFLSAACVPVYLHAADPIVWRWAKYYFCCYAVIGVVLFSAFYPWV